MAARERVSPKKENETYGKSAPLAFVPARLFGGDLAGGGDRHGLRQMGGEASSAAPHAGKNAACIGGTGWQCGDAAHHADHPPQDPAPQIYGGHPLDPSRSDRIGILVDGTVNENKRPLFEAKQGPFCGFLLWRYPLDAKKAES